MAAENKAQATIHKSLVFIRVASVVFIVLGVLLLALGVVMGLGLYAMGASGIDVAETNIVLVLFLAQGAFYLILGILGIRCARNRFKVMPFCVLSIVLAVATIIEQAANNYAAVSGAFTGGWGGIIYLLFCVICIMSAFVSVALVGYNKRHPADETEVPMPAYVPNSMQEENSTPIQEGAAPVSVPASVSESEASAEQPVVAQHCEEPLQLRISSKFGSLLHNKIDVLDQHDNVIYRVHSKAIALNDRTFIEDADGNEVANIHAKVVSIHHIYYVEMADGSSFEMSREIMHIKDVIDIEALGWQIAGENIFEFNFDITDAAGAMVARANRKLLDIHDAYTVDVYDRAHTDEIMAVFVIVKHMMEQRQASVMDSASQN